MATKEQVEQLLSLQRKQCSKNFWKKTDSSNAGLGAVLRCLMRHEGKATPGEISDEIYVSTARVAALLKKLEQRTLIVRYKDETDARVTVVKLTDEGWEIARTMQENLYQELEKLIDEFGMEKMLEFVEMKARMIEIVDHSKFILK